jgi:hypothetical protein
MSDRSKYVRKVKSYQGTRKGSRRHRHIVNTFNRVKPDGWAMTYTAPWCACFTSAVGIEVFGKTKAAEIFPLSANCGTIISKAKARGRWVERDNYVPSAGDWIIYTWTGRQTGADHVGVVTSVKKGVINVMEGNKGVESVVGARAVPVGSWVIRGFVRSKFTAAAKTSKSATATKTIKKYTTYKVTAKKGLNVRRGAGTKYGIKTAIPYRTVVRIAKTKSGWGYSPVLKGWLSLKYLQKEQKASVKTAKKS